MHFFTVPETRTTILMNRINHALFSAALSAWVREAWPGRPEVVAIDGKTSIADLAGAKFGAQIGTTSYKAIVDQIKPTTKPAVYNDNDLYQPWLPLLEVARLTRTVRIGPATVNRFTSRRGAGS